MFNCMCQICGIEVASYTAVEKDGWHHIEVTCHGEQDSAKILASNVWQQVKKDQIMWMWFFPPTNEKETK